MAFKITGIRKPGGATNTHAAISHYRWQDDLSTKGGVTDRVTVVGWVDGGIKAYVADAGGKVWCQVRQNDHGTRYLQTVADGNWSNNLLALPEC